jgi:hypothetical protein
MTPPAPESLRERLEEVLREKWRRAPALQRAIMAQLHWFLGARFGILPEAFDEISFSLWHRIRLTRQVRIAAEQLRDALDSLDEWRAERIQPARNLRFYNARYRLGTYVGRAGRLRKPILADTGCPDDMRAVDLMSQRMRCALEQFGASHRRALDALIRECNEDAETHTFARRPGRHPDYGREELVRRTARAVEAIGLPTATQDTGVLAGAIRIVLEAADRIEGVPIRHRPRIARHLKQCLAPPHPRETDMKASPRDRSGQ